MLRRTTYRARPGLVALYDIRPGNGAGQFLQVTTPEPAAPHGAANAIVAAETAADNNSNSSSSDIFDVNTDVTPLTHCGAKPSLRIFHYVTINK